ncbi:MAG: 4Fe-4S dicluster domain-containing protein [Desulfobacterales bacterium]|nr:4Fe-4S dicluster domain-containing protein [Desulfobacterales bacterium]
MDWSETAENEIKKVPFFVRKKVRKRVEKEALLNGKKVVSPDDVLETKNKFLNYTESEIKGYRVEACFSQGKCPNMANDTSELVIKTEHVFQQENLLDFLKKNVKGPLKFHHEFSVSLSDCPNCCSQPQIKDIGIIGAVTPQITEKTCSLCMECENVCRENSIKIDQNEEKPKIDNELCLNCGQCIKVCSSEVLKPDKIGFKILLGGKLGRHPKLAEELNGIYTEEGTLAIIKKCINYYKENSKNGKRFATIYKNSNFLIH